VEIRFPQKIDMASAMPKGFQSEPRATYMLDLSPGPEQLWSGALSSSCRRAVRKATSAGVTIEEGDLGAHLDRYYAMAVGVFAKSHRPPSLDKDDYAALAAIARDGGPVKVWFASLKGRVIAAGIFPYDEHSVYYLDGVSDPDGQEVRPNNLLHWEVIRWACAHGLSRYDMVGAGIESIARFKRGFGSVEVPYTYAFRSLDLVTSAARSTYAFLAPAGRAVQHAAQWRPMRGQPKAPAEA
jgi:lipid II:glycine glycyltransferase (peptidoglycan interpeptide bridge formation enzyme)